jgi:GT2 family glycosyltransferase
MQPKTYIILLNYNGWEDSIECIESIFKCHNKNYHIILVDNNSPNNSVEKIELWAKGKLKIELDESNKLKSKTFPFIQKPLKYRLITEDESCNYFGLAEEYQLTIIKANKNKGFSYGNNIGIKHALSQKDSDFFWILNNDTIIDPNSLDELLKYFNKNSNRNLGILGAKVKYYDEPNMIQCAGGAKYNKWLAYGKQIGNQTIDNGEYDNNNINPDLIIGASMFVSNDFIKNVGLLSEDYFLYFEEQDWAERAKRKSFTLEYNYKAVIYHKEGRSIGGNQLNIRGISKLSDFYYARNKILFTKKFHNNFCVIMVYLSFFLIVANRIRRRQIDRIPMLIKIVLNPNKHYFEIK